MNPSGYVSRTREIDYQSLQLYKEESAAPAFKRMLAHIRADRLPDREYRELFTSTEIDRLLLVNDPRALGPAGSFGGSSGKMKSRAKASPIGEREILLLGTTPEQAQGRARALLSILDQGYTRPIQKELFNVRTTQCALLREARDKRAVTYKAFVSLRARLKQFEEFTPDMLPGLRLQQLQLEVDLAGVKARIKTCEKLLAKTEGIAEKAKPIEDARIAAEIELSGFEARRAKSAEFISMLRERDKLVDMISTAENETIQHLGKVQALTGVIQSVDHDIAAFAPVRLVDDRVTIHPLEWTQ